MIKEIGGFLEIEQYHNKMIHENAIALNSARNCLAYFVIKKKIKSLWIPKFLCSCVREVCERENVEVKYYSINTSFEPLLESTSEWVYIVNYYGQFSVNRIVELRKKYNNIIVDNVQAFFQKPVEGIPTIYTCRKFFGVTDGAFLYGDIEMDDLELDESLERVKYLFGRFEKKAADYYNEYIKCENDIGKVAIKQMSKITRNFLHAIDYNYVKEKRNNNFNCLYQNLKHINKLEIVKNDGPYMYPLLVEDGINVRKKLQEKKIYISTLWPDVFDICEEDDTEYMMAANILPIPVDQRYEESDMLYIVDEIKSILNNKEK